MDGAVLLEEKPIGIIASVRCRVANVENAMHFSNFFEIQPIVLKPGLFKLN